MDNNSYNVLEVMGDDMMIEAGVISDGGGVE